METHVNIELVILGLAQQIKEQLRRQVACGEGCNVMGRLEGGR